MEQNAIFAYVGKSFQVTLRSMIGSTNYGWGLTNLPEGIILTGYDAKPAGIGIAPTNQTFLFGITHKIVDKDLLPVLTFQMFSYSDLTKCVETIQIPVNVSDAPIDADNQDEKVIYVANCAVYNIQIPYGFPLTSDPLLKYGAPCDNEVSMAMKYGYPVCPTDEPLIKYGAPCDNKDSIAMKYGYPVCPTDEPLIKYGAPCDNEDSIAMKYGYPVCPTDEPLIKYGAPCDNADLAVKYGFADCE